MAQTPGNWIEPPPSKPSGTGCVTKAVIAFVLLALLLAIGTYFFVRHGLVASAPVQLPVQDLPPAQLAAVQQRIEQFQNAPASPTVAPTPAESAAPDATPAPAEPTGKELVLTASEINGIIAANPKA